MGQSPFAGGASGVIQFLSLYLLVLAFFILLVAISTFEDIKSKAVMDSLSSTFASVLPPTTSLTTFTSDTGNVLAGQEFLDEVKGLFETEVGVTKVEIIQSGQLLRVVLSADELFAAGEPKIRDAQLPLVDRVVGTLSASPPGLLHEIEFVIATESRDGRILPVEQTLQMARAGEFARQLIARGAPRQSVSIGLRRGRADQIELLFRVRSRKDARKLTDRLSGQPDAQGEEP